LHKNSAVFAPKEIFCLIFLTLALISLFLFTKGNGHTTKKKKTRNKVYRTCGIIILLSIGLIALYDFSGDKFHRFDEYKPVFWIEWVALTAFGTSWLVKGKLLLDDDSK